MLIEGVLPYDTISLTLGMSERERERERESTSTNIYTDNINNCDNCDFQSIIDIEEKFRYLPSLVAS